jgi:tRNA(fMet)-specific endonuclease VapC
MTEFLLDSNHASPLVTLDHPLRIHILSAIQAGESFALTTVNLTEVWYGISLLPRAIQNQREWMQIRTSLSIYQIEETDALAAAELQISLRRRGRQLGIIDALIAAIALRYDLTLLTTDSDFDAVSDLKHKNWLPRVSA